MDLGDKAPPSLRAALKVAPKFGMSAQEILDEDRRNVLGEDDEDGPECFGPHEYEEMLTTKSISPELLAHALECPSCMTLAALALPEDVFQESFPITKNEKDLE